MKTATVNVRLEPKLKAKAERVLKVLGLSPTDALTLYYRQIALRGGLPFDVCIPNAETLAAFEEDRAGKGRVFEGSTEEAFKTILR
jgi:DNA-damage-inducible protein J